MNIYPAIDVLDGRVVRLHQGQFDAVTDYGGDPLSVAQSYLDAGSEWVHLVDLSGARDGERRQFGLIEKIASLGLNVQTGGGIRSERNVRDILNAGANRAVIGSLATSEPQTVMRWLEIIGGDNLTLAFDVEIEDGVHYPTLEGWTERSDRTLSQVLNSYRGAGLKHAMATDISRDGTLTGPNLDLYRHLMTAEPDIAWQVSGGISSLKDITEVRETGAPVVIIGKALFEGRFTLEQALAC